MVNKSIVACSYFVLLNTATCTPQYKNQCEFDLRVILLEKDKVHDYCRNVIGSCPDDGCKYKDIYNAGGCADPNTNTIVIVDDDVVIGHEMRHIMEIRCLDK